MVVLAALAAVVLSAPACFTGLQTEDWVQRALVATGQFDVPTRMNLYGHHEAATWESIEKRNMEYRIWGWFPWITHPRFDVSFWRPLSSATHLLDYRLWPEHPWVMHLESVLWYGALVAAVALLYRKMIADAWLAGVAGVLYAVDDAHGHAIGWLANRNGIMAATFGVVALLLLDRWRRGGRRWAAFLLPVAFALALSSAEFGLSAAGYFVAYALVLDPAPLPRRLVASLPWALTIAAWVFVYRGLGHAAHNSGLYVSPVNEPLTFAFELVERATMLFAGQLAGPPAEIWTRVDRRVQGAVVFGSALVLWWMGRLLLPLLRSRRDLRFWALGAVLSMPPACAAFPEDRLLFFVGIGATPVITALIDEVLQKRSAAWTQFRWVRASALTLALLHGVLAPILLPYRVLYMHRYDRDMQDDARSLFRHVSHPAEESLILVNARDFYFAGMLPLSRSARRESTVGRMLTLAGTPAPVTVTRIDARTVKIEPEGGFMTRELNRIYRGRADAIERGSEIDLLGVRVRVTEVDPWGEPLAATFEFALPLESERYAWTAWNGATYERFRLPAVGGHVLVGGGA